MQLLRYRLSTGQLAGIYEANDLALLEAQAVPDDPTWGFLFPEDEIPVSEQDRWEVSSGAIVAKTPLSLAPSSLTFVADGVDTCDITVTPFVPCSLDVDGLVLVLTEGDPAVTLTSDVPRHFRIALVPMAGYWAEPLSVEAVEE